MTTRDDSTILSREECRRYGRHLTLPEVGVEGQLRLRRSSVLVVGAGGLGSPAALYLAAAGVGRLGLVDPDEIELSNLQRQVLYSTREVGRPKAEVARRRLLELNPLVRVEPHPVKLVAANAREIIEPYDVVIDGTDNIPARYLLNDACVLLGKPFVHGSVFRFEGLVSVFAAARGPCYRCLYPDPPALGSVPDCVVSGVLGVLPGVIGALQATEAVKLLLGRGDPLVGRLLLFDALEAVFRAMSVERNPACRVCGGSPDLIDLRDLPDESCLTLGAEQQISVEELRSLMERRAPLLLLDVRTQSEWNICRLDGARLIPLHDLASRLADLDRDRPIVVYCRAGIRGALALALLRQRGITDARNLSGGLDAWAERIDPEMPRY